MKLRSLTGFLSLSDPLDDHSIQALGSLARTARDEFARAGFPLQTTRLATQPLSQHDAPDLVRFARELEIALRANGIDYASLGAPHGEDAIAQSIPSAILAAETVFGSVRITTDHHISFTAIQTAARIIRELADATPDGFNNFRFAALAHCPAHSPYFPVAYHDGSQPAFALATEGAPLALEAFSNATSLDDARANLVTAIEHTGDKLTQIAQSLAREFSSRFVGIDFSMAPYPSETHSIGAALEQLSGAPFGERGTLFAAAFVTDCIQRARFPRVGFSGLMLPVLEDSTLARNSTRFSLDSLLLYSTVCGAGLDTIPLPGSMSSQALAAVLLDLATLAVKLKKPLTARLIPIPGLETGDTTRFDFQYFANAQVLNGGIGALKVFESNQHIAL